MRMRSILLPFLLVSCHALLYEHVSELPTDNYEFVIIGGGTAGLVIANRLTEDPKVSVLVIEAGGSNENVTDSIIPFFGINLSEMNPWNWNITIVPQPALNGRQYLYERGHILGGSSSINAMFYTRGSKENYDNYAKLAGDEGWSWDNLQPYFRKNEQWTTPTDNHNTTGQFDPSVHGFHGMNAVSLAGFPSGIDHRVIKTTEQLPNEFPFNLDLNSGMPLGVSWLQATIKKGRRSSSATSYLAPQFLKRENLHVLVNSQVTRILQTNGKNEPVAFKAVEFSQGRTEDAPRFQVHATNEVILSAGAVGSPWILMNSGIGDEKELEALGVEPLHNLPSVGKNTSDHVRFFLAWTVNSTDTIDSISQNATLFEEAFEMWNRTGGGPFGNSGATHMAWLRLPSNASIFDTFADPAAGPNTPHFELVTSNGIFEGTAPGNHLVIGIAVVATPGRGSVKLASKNPFTLPLVDPAALSTDYDVFTARAALRAAQRFVTAPIWKDYILDPVLGLEDIHTDEDADAYIRSTATSTSHIVGSAAMSPKDATYGVVNPDLLVKGILGLRIVDSSVIPIVPSAHTQAATYAFAERAADLIKQHWKLK